MKPIYYKIFTVTVPTLIILLTLTGLYLWQYKNPTAHNLSYQGVTDKPFNAYYNDQTPTPAQTTTEISFFAVGDIMLSRNVAGQMKKNDYDYYWPFRGLENTFYETDFNFGNLESPFSGRDDFNPSGSLIFNAPTWTRAGLAQYNFKVLNLANNHSMDQGLDGLLYTKKFLTDHNTTVVGVGSNLEEAWQGGVYSTKGIRVGFVGASYSSINDGGSATNNYVARIEDTASLKKTIADLQTKSDFIIATMHAGNEYVRYPNQAQINFARSAIDFGADMVLGAHPHWIQTFEKYKNKYIFYSLGNFIFDQEWSQETKEGLMLKITITKDGSCTTDKRMSSSGQQQVVCSDALQGSKLGAQLKQIDLVPVIIESFGQPRLADEHEKAKILKKIEATSSTILP